MSYGKLGYRSARKLHVLHPNSDDRQEAAPAILARRYSRWHV